MKHCCTIFLGLLCWSVSSAQNSLPESRKTSPETFIYQLDRKDLRDLHLKDRQPGEAMLHTFVGRYPDSVKIPELPRGNYLRVRTEGSKLVFSNLVVDNFYSSPVKDERVMLMLCDTTGNIIRNAVVKQGSKRLKFDPATQTYNTRRIGDGKVVEVDNDGVMHYITFEKDEGYPPHAGGFFKTGWQKIKYAFKRVFAPGRLPQKNKYDGFVVFSKPRYKPGETVRFKAHINRKGRPCDEKIDVALVSYYSPAIDTTLTALQPYRPGMYEWEFRLSDSLRLRLDKNYHIVFKTKEKNTNDISGSFYYEEYELDRITFTATAGKEQYVRGDTVKLTLKAADENNMPVYDGRVEITIKPSQYRRQEYLSRTAFVPDEIWKHSFGMEGKASKELTLPDSIFVRDVSMSYDVACTFFDAGNEKQERHLTLFRDARRRMIDYSVDKGMLTLRELADGRSVETPALLTAYNSEYDIVSQDSVTLPCTLPLSWIVSEYEVKTAAASEDIHVESLPGELLGYRFFRENGNVRLTVDNPAKFPFWYTIRRGGKTIEKGYTAQLDFSRRDRGKKGYAMQLSYLQGENAQTMQEGLPYTEKNLSMEVSTATSVYPGQTAEVEVAVKDRRGRPVKNADVTAYAFTSKFGSYAPPVTIFGKSTAGRAIIPANYDADEDFFRNRIPMDWQLWRQRMGLDSIEYYKFLYPEPFYSYSEQAPGRLTQLSPYVVIDGEVQGVHILWIDEQPHYFSQAEQLNAYSFPVWPGIHSLRMRTYDREVTVDNVFVGEGTKTIISVDGKQEGETRILRAPAYDRPVRISVAESGKKEKGRLTEWEASVLKKHLITVDDTFGSVTLLTTKHTGRPYATQGAPLPGILQAGGIYYYLNHAERQQRYDYRGFPRAGRPILAGPFPYRGFAGDGKFAGTLWSDTLLVNNFEIEGGNRYGIWKGYLKQQSWEREPFRREIARFTPEVSFTQNALTADTIRELFRKRLTETLRRRVGLIGTAPTVHPQDKCRLQIGIGRMADRKTSKDVVLVHLRSDGDFPTEKLYHGVPGRIDQLPEGNITVSLIFSDTTRCSASVNLRKNGINHLRMDSLATKPADSFSRGLFRRLEQYLEVSRPAAPLADYDPSEWDRINPLTNPGGFSENNFTGKVITGTVRDSQGEPVIGATVMVEGTKTGVVTDQTGRFRMPDPGKGTLLVTYIGYRPFTTRIRSGYNYNIVLQEDANALDEVVVVGYGTAKRKAFTGSRVLTQESIEYDEATAAPAEGALAGMIAGVQVGDIPNIQIRGNSAITDENAPLILVNGVPYDGALSDFDPAAIRSMNILKSADAAIYGARAANGVILIETTDLPAASGEETFLPEPIGTNSLRTDFRDDAFWQPRLTTDEKGKLTFEVTYPDDITNWNANFIAVGGRRQTDKKQVRIKSFKPLNAQLSVPRFAVEGDSLTAVGRLTNHLGDTLTVQRTVETDAHTDSGDVRFATSHTDAIPATAVGQDSIRITYSLTAPNGYFDGERRAIPVYKAGVLETHGQFAVLNDTVTRLFTPDPALGEVTLHAEASGMQTFLDEIEKVDRYPYLCNEQMASKVKVLLSKKRIYDLLGKKFGDDAKIGDLIRKLLRNQNGDKLWGWWNQENTELWISQQVIEALLDAEAAGYKTGFDRQPAIFTLLSGLNNRLSETNAPDPAGIRKNEILFLLEALHKLDAKIDYPRYCNFVAAMPDTLLCTRLKTMETLMRLAPGRKPDTDSLLRLSAETMMGSLYWADAEGPGILPRPFMLPNLNTAENTLAAYRILRAAGGHETELEKIRNYFFEQRRSGSWRNTYESSRIVETILPDMLEKSGGELEEPALTVNGERSGKFPLTRTYGAGEEIRIKKEGSAPVFFTAYQQAWNADPDRASEGFSVTTAFSRDDRPVTELRAGESVTLTATVTADSDAEYVMIEIPVPAGCSYDSKEQGGFRQETHREYYKEKVAVFCNRLAKGKHAFTVELLPRYTGSYHLNPARAELMYFPVFFGRETMKKCGIAEPQESR